MLGGWRGCVSVTAINGLIMYLAVLASCEKGEGGRERGERGEEKGLTVCHGWLKTSWERREKDLVCWAKCCK